MDKRMLYVFILLILFSQGVVCGGVVPEKPNFIIIFADDLGYGDLGCFGHPTIRTPHLDRMAKEGQKWTNFYVGASVCTPSRGALMTGRLPMRNGTMSKIDRVFFPYSREGMPESEITIAECLKTADYATTAIGKWHLGHKEPYLPTNQGFDSYWGIPYSNDMDEKYGVYPDYQTMAEQDPNYVAPIGQYNVPILSNTEEIERPADQHTLTRRYIDKAVEFIHTNKDRPFFLYLAHSLPHIPLYAGESHLGTSRRGLYGDVIEEIDTGVGEIIAALEEHDLQKKTMVIFTSDNGPWLLYDTHGGSAGILREGKGTTFEGGMREPTIFWWPDVIPHSVQMELGATMDLLPTICALAGVPAPTDRPLDGYDLSALLLGDTDTSPRDRIFYWREEELYAVRVGPWKAHFITEGCYGEGPERQDHITPELYNLEQDPSEKYNVAAQYPEVVARLTAIAEEHKAEIAPEEPEKPGRGR